MEESTVYQVILEKGIEKGIEKGEAHGRAEGARSALLAAGRRKLGRPTKRVLTALEQISDADRLVRMSEALLDIKTWDQLLAVQ